jgi:hypothetical protein
VAINCVEAFRLAVAEMGDASSSRLASCMARKYGVRIEPGFIPVFRASQQQRERMTRLRQAARTVCRKVGTPCPASS